MPTLRIMIAGALCLPAAAKAGQEERVRFTDVVDAFETARQGGMLVVLYFHDPGCEASGRIAKDVFEDSETAKAANEAFLHVALSREAQSELASKFGVRQSPAFRVATGEGRWVGGADGELDAEEYRDRLKVWRKLSGGIERRAATLRDEPAPYVELGDLLLQSGAFESALRHYRRAIDLARDDRARAAIWGRVGEAVVLCHGPEQDLQEAARRADPRSALYLRAVLAWQKGRVAEVRDLAMQALSGATEDGAGDALRILDALASLQQGFPAAAVTPVLAEIAAGGLLPYRWQAKRLLRKLRGPA